MVSHLNRLLRLARLIAGMAIIGIGISACLGPRYEWTHPDYSGEIAVEQKTETETLCRAKADALVGPLPSIYISEPRACSSASTDEARQICRDAKDQQRKIVSEFESARSHRIRELTYGCLENAGWVLRKIEDKP